MFSLWLKVFNIEGNKMKWVLFRRLDGFGVQSMNMCGCVLNDIRILVILFYGPFIVGAKREGGCNRLFPKLLSLIEDPYCLYTLRDHALLGVTPVPSEVFRFPSASMHLYRCFHSWKKPIWFEARFPGSPMGATLTRLSLRSLAIRPLKVPTKFRERLLK